MRLKRLADLPEKRLARRLRKPTQLLLLQLLRMLQRLPRLKMPLQPRGQP